MMNEKKTNFSLACTLLSKMVKDKGSLADLALAKGMHIPPTTMNLLPGLEVSADKQADTYDTKCMDLFPVYAVEPEPEKEKPQLTIFYAGNVFVFDDFPAVNAKDLMQMASNAASSSSSTAAVAADRLPQGCPSTSGSLAPAKLNHSTDLLAQTRRASLHRFLNKRKERINANAPYQINSSPKKTHAVAKPVPKPDATRSWLGMRRGGIN
ncbi:protein TIFY 10c-like isoform X1 [Iris pallida]|uniref:Protein TIFY n=1 Tax=Iris pallida TaxID=29817 RepID=A0AAX6G5U9_IRIPA|nr:protein TIFY 10c-like isoform X1 [Iris pallida]